MMLQFFVPPFVLALPMLKRLDCNNLCENDENVSYHDSDDEISLPSLSGLSVGSDSSYHSCGGLSHVEMCELLGPRVSQDEPKHVLPAGFAKPKNLEHSVTFHLPVGYFQLRRLFLSDSNDFWDCKILDRTLKYMNVTTHGWDRHQNVIGSISSSTEINDENIVGATRKTEYMMPKTGLVRANMAFETATITEYNDHCFAIDMSTSNPDVPFGKIFTADTKIVVYNMGENTCRMECSVQTNFKNSPPSPIAWKIKNAMKHGSMEVFEKISGTIREANIYS